MRTIVAVAVRRRVSVIMSALAVVSVLAGARNPDQVRQNVRAAEIQLTDDVLDLRRPGPGAHAARLLFRAANLPGMPRPRKRSFRADCAPAGMLISTLPPSVSTGILAPRAASQGVMSRRLWISLPSTRYRACGAISTSR